MLPVWEKITIEESLTSFPTRPALSGQSLTCPIFKSAVNFSLVFCFLPVILVNLQDLITATQPIPIKVLSEENSTSLTSQLSLSQSVLNLLNFLALLDTPIDCLLKPFKPHSAVLNLSNCPTVFSILPVILC